MMVQLTQIIDTLYLKYRLTNSDLRRATHHYSLEDDKDVKELIAANMEVKMKLMQEKDAAMKLTED